MEYGVILIYIVDVRNKLLKCILEKKIFDILKLRLFFIGDVNGIYCLKDFN